MSEQKFIAKMTGYKATDANMRCRDVQFTLGEWAEVTGEIETCRNGFHFCEQPSGPWTYYSAITTRVFRIEAEDVLEVPFEAGADFKRVCRRIRLIEEIKPDGDGNTGYGNTGDGNTGDRNTGDSNTGDSNTGNRNTGYLNTGNGNTGNGNKGYRNTGDSNTGDSNTGNRNTGDRNTGDGNTGYGNTGDGNTGDGNTGNLNTGDLNTGNRNTGDGNATSWSTGFFCQEEQTVQCFDVDSGLKRNAFVEKFPCYADLAYALMRDESIDFSLYATLPGITQTKLASLHAKHIAARRAKEGAK